MDTPYQWTKQVASHWGGTRNATIVRWPGSFQASGEVRFPQPPGVIEILTGRGFQTDQPALKIRGNIHYEEYW